MKLSQLELIEISKRTVIKKRECPLIEANQPRHLAVGVSSIVVMTPMHGENLLKKQTTHKFFDKVEIKVSKILTVGTMHSQINVNRSNQTDQN